MSEPYTFTREAAERIVRAVRLMESTIRPQPDPRLFAPLNWQQVRCTGAAAGAGSGAGSAGAGSGNGPRYYPGQVELWNAEAEEPEVLGEIWILDRNRGQLISNQVYNAVESGTFAIDDEERPLFTTAEFGYGIGTDGAGSGGLESLGFTYDCVDGFLTLTEG